MYNIIGYVFLGMIVAGLVLICLAPFILSGKISEQEERHGQ